MIVYRITVSTAIEPFLTKSPIDYLREKSPNNVTTFYGFNTAESFMIMNWYFHNPEFLQTINENFEIELPFKFLDYSSATKVNIYWGYARFYDYVIMVSLKLGTRCHGKCDSKVLLNKWHVGHRKSSGNDEFNK